jgi:hypothetical protein
MLLRVAFFREELGAAMTTELVEPETKDDWTDPLEMLIKEARQLQRRQRRKGWAVLLVALAVVGAALFFAAGDGRRPPRGVTLNHPSRGLAPNSVPSSRSNSTKSRISALAALPICAINNFVISGNQSDGGLGSYNTYVYLTNSGPSCRLVPIGARAYSDSTHSFVGTAATINKPDGKTGALFPYKTTHLLGSVAYGQRVSLLLSYADVGLGSLNDCGEVKAANSMAFWMTTNPHVIKTARLVFGLRGAFRTLQTCSKAKYLGVFWPSTGNFWFAS